MTRDKKADGVFEGGGVKGIGLVGALTVAEEKGYKDWQRIAGTSAGAIVVSLIASGYDSHRIKEIMMEIDYSDLLDYTSYWDILTHPAGTIWGALTDYGANKSDLLQEWLKDKLAAESVETFADLRTWSEKEKYKYKLRIIASDILRRNMVVLPQEIKKYGEGPDQLSVARAVGMSILFPGFFKPEKLNCSYIIDGGVLSNFPVWLFDEKNDSKFPTFGFKLLEKDQAITGPISFVKETFYTMLEAHDNEHQEDHNTVRTIPIPSKGVSPLAFNLSREDKQKLFRSGREAAREFLGMKLSGTESKFEA